MGNLTNKESRKPFYYFDGSYKQFKKEGSSYHQIDLLDCLSSDETRLQGVLEYLDQFMNHEAMDDRYVEKLLSSNITTNTSGTDTELFQAQRYMSQVNALLTCGFKTPESNVTDLKNPISEKYFTEFDNKDELTNYRDTQLKKIQILFALYQLKTEDCNSEKTFHSYMQEFFGQSEDFARPIVTMQVGFSFVIGILRELQGVRSGQLLIGVLQQLVKSLRDVEPGQLFANDKFSFKLDTSLNESREFLVQLICNPQSSKEMRTLSYKALLLLGLARNNVEDLLILCNLLSLKTATEVDLRDELRILCDLNLKKDTDKNLHRQVINNPPMNCYGEASRSLNGQYHIKSGSDNYCVCEGNFQRPLQVEAWLKAESRGEVSMSLFNSTNNNKGGYCLQTRYYEAYVYNNSEEASEPELDFSSNNEWHKVVIDAQSNGKVKYQIFHDDKMADELTVTDDKLHVGNLKFFANDQDLYVKDVKIIQTTQGSNEDGLGSGGQDLKVLSNIPVKLLMCSTGSYRIYNFESAQMVYDSQYIYALTSNGLYKISNSAGKIVAINQEIQHDNDYGDYTSMMIHKNEIYLRSKTQKWLINPFQIIDKNTLKTVEIKDEEFYNPPEDVSQNLKWTDEEEFGRSLSFSPCFSDGHYIYVLARWKPIEVDYDEDTEDKMAFKVEQYEPIDGFKQFKFIKDVKLLKQNKDKAFFKDENSSEWLNSTNWACNGQYITCFSRKDHKLRIFRLDNGKMRKKIETVFSGTSQVLYDPNSNQFIQVDEKNELLEYINFTVKDYFESEQSGIKKVKCLELDNLQKLLLDKNQDEKKEDGLQSLDLIDQILRGVSNSKIASESSNYGPFDQLEPSKVPGVSRALILKFIAQKCSEFDLKFKAVDEQKKDAKTVVGIFRYPLATYLTPYTFNSLRNGLKEGATLLQKPPAEVEVYELHALLNLLQVVLANIKALNFCKINISSILYQEYEYKFFMQAFNDCVIKLTKESDAEKKTRIESQEPTDAKTIWSQLYEISLDIRQQSINQLSKGPDILNTIKLSLMANRADQVQMHLFHLSQQKNIQSLFSEKMTEQKMQELLAAFQTVISLDRGFIQKTLAQIDFHGSGKILDDQNESQVVLQNACKTFLQNFAQEVIVRCCQTAQKKQIEQTLIYENLAQKVIKTSLQELSAYFDTVVTDLNKICAETKDWSDMEDKYKAFSEKMSKVFTEQITHYQLSMLFVQSFAIHNPIGQTILNELYLGTKQVMQSMSHFYYIWQDYGHKLGLGGNMSKIENKVIDDSLQMVIGKLMRHLNWYLGHIAYDLIKFDKEEEGQTTDKAQQRKDLIKLVLQSNLLSGGVELRHLGVFSEQTKEQYIEGYAQIRGDTNLIDQLNKQTSSTEEDKILEAIISQGKIKNVDIAIKFLQLIYETKKPVRIAQLGQAAGLRMTRAAFAIMIKFSDLIDDFSQLIMAIEMEAQMGDNKAVIQFILKLPQAELIIAKWVSASNMRQWINDQKRNLMTKFEKQVEQEIKDKKQGQELNSDDRTFIDDEAFNRLDTELLNIFEKIQNKALFIIKLSIPKVFKRNDPTKSKEGQLAILRPPDFVPKQDPKKRFEWELRLKVWKQMQTSKGAIRSFTEVKQEIWNYGITSIIALLQTPISSDQILQQVEQIFVQGCKRATGLKIINDLFKIEKPRLLTNELIGWFCSSLRKNENKLTHFLDDITGQGYYLEQQSRHNFFEILKQLVIRLETSKNEKEQKMILEALKWKYSAEDHIELAKINIFSVLHQKEIWGKPLSKKYTYPEHQDFQNSVLEIFEHIFLSVVGRIAQTDEGEDIKVKSSSGSSALVMKKAKSTIDQSVSEVLIVQAFDVIFKEIERYNNQIRTSASVNWPFYTKCKNDKVKLNKSDDEDHESEEYKSEFDDEVPNDTEQKSEAQDTPVKVKEEPSGEVGEIEGEDGELKTSEVIQPSEQPEVQEPTEEEMMKNFVENIQARWKNEQKSISAFYSEKFLKRLLRLLEIFTSISTQQSGPLQMVKKIANPHLMSKLFELILQGTPSIKIIVLKIVQHFIEIQLPTQIFEDAVIQLQQDESSFARFLVNFKSDNGFVKFEKSFLLRLLFNYMYLTTSKMYDDSKADSDGMGAVAQNLAVTLRLIMTSKEQSLGINLTQIMREEINKVILQDLCSEESDAFMSLLGGQISGQTAGDFAMTSQRQFVTILGYSSSWKPIDEIFAQDEEESAMNKVIKNLKITPEFEALDQKAICLFFDKDQRDRQEIITVNPLSLTPVPSLDEQRAIEIARMSPLMDEKVISSLLTSLEKTTLQRQSQILKIICNQIEILGLEFIKILQADKSQWLKIVKRNPVPAKLLEYKLSKMRKVALEGYYQLLQPQKQKIKVKLLKSKKELVFAKIDHKNGRTKRFNAFVKSAINLDFVQAGEIDRVKFAKIEKVDSETMYNFDHYGTVISPCSPDLKIQEIFQKIYKEYKNDPTKYPNALHTTIYFISPEDYAKIYSETEVQDHDGSKKLEGVQRVLSDLKEWANMNDDLLLFNLDYSDLTNTPDLMRKIIEGLQMEQDTEKNILMRQLKRKLQFEHKDTVISSRLDKVELMKSLLLDQNSNQIDQGQTSLNIGSDNLPSIGINEKWTSKIQKIKMLSNEQKENRIDIRSCKISVQFNDKQLQKEYQKGLRQIIDEYWSDCLFKMMQKGKLEEVLTLLQKDQLITYLMVQFNSSVLEMTQMNQKLPYQQTKALLRQVFEIDNFKEQFFRQYIMQSGSHTIKQYDSKSPDANYLKSPENLNPYFLRFFTGHLIKMEESGAISKHIPDLYSNLLTLHLCMICLFQKQNSLVTKLLKSCLKIANFVYTIQDQIPQEQKDAFVGNDVLRNLVENLNLDEKCKEKFVDSKLMILELYFVIGDIGKQNVMEDHHINKMRRSRQILKEKNSLDFVKYLYHLEKLSAEQKAFMDVRLKSGCFNTQTGSLIKIDQVDSYEIKFPEECKYRDFSSIGFGNQKNIVSETINNRRALAPNLTWQSNELLITYPIQKQCIVGFGNALEGHGENNFDFKSSSTNRHNEEFNPVQIARTEGYTAAIDKDGNFYDADLRDKININGDQENKFKQDPKIKNVKLISTNGSRVTVVLEDNTIYNKGNCIKKNPTKKEFEKINFEKSRAGEKFVQLASAPNWVLVLGQSGNLWALGPQLQKWYKDEEPNDEEFQIKLPENMECKQVWTFSSDANDDKVCIIAKLQERTTGDVGIYSMGNYLLGHEDSTLDIKQFKKVEAFSDLQIKEICIGTSFVMAIDGKGKIWGWGMKQAKDTNNGLFGLVGEEDIQTPSLIKKLNDLENLSALKVSLCSTHALILYEKFGQTYLYSVGVPDDKNFLHLGFSEKQPVEETDQTFREIPTFAGRPISQILASQYSSMVLLEASPDPSDYTGYIYQTQDGKYHYQKTKFPHDDLPDICIVLKSPLQVSNEEIEKMEWPDLRSVQFEEGNDDHGVKCSITGQDVKGVLYQSRCSVSKEVLEQHNYSEQAFEAGQHADTNPLIFYRLNKKVIDSTSIPNLELTNYYKKDKKAHLSIEITPDLTTRKNDKLIEKTQEQWQKIQKIDKEFDNKYLTELAQGLNQKIEEMIVKNEDQSFEDINFDDLNLEGVTFKDPELQALSDEAKLQKAQLLILLNKHIKIVLPYRCGLLKKMPGSIFQLVSQMRSSMLGCVKNTVIDDQINSMEETEREEINLSRHTAQQFKDSGQCDHNGEYTIFGQIHKKAKQNEKFIKCFQKNTTDSMAFKTYFQGEGSDDYGGPFRECLANLVTEIESDALPLFIKTTNNRTDHGISRECFIPNSSSISPSHESMFKLLGALIGFNLRTKSSLDWHLPPLFWKTLLGDTLGLADLEHIDAYSYQILREIRVNAEQYSPEEFDMAVFENFTTVLSNGQTVDLQEGGSNIQLNHANHKTFIDLVTKVRVSESQKQMNWIKEGINEAIDLNSLTFLTWEELEMRACGKKEITTPHLKSITIYEDCYETHNMVKMFWQMFEMLDQDERKKYLKFVWGRSNLPSDTSKLEYKHKIQLLTDSDKKDTLPLSHTCFFTIDIPIYSTLEIMLKRVKTAIELCGEIDGDEYMLERE